MLYDHLSAERDQIFPVFKVGNNVVHHENIRGPHNRNIQRPPRSSGGNILSLQAGADVAHEPEIIQTVHDQVFKTGKSTDDVAENVQNLRRVHRIQVPVFHGVDKEPTVLQHGDQVGAV